MQTGQMVLKSLCELAGCVLIIIGFIYEDKLVSFERRIVRIAAVYVAGFNACRKERKRVGRINEK